MVSAIMKSFVDRSVDNKGLQLLTDTENSVCVRMLPNTFPPAARSVGINFFCYASIHLDLPILTGQSIRRMSEKMKLIYFKSPGKAEITRLLFKLADKEFIDERIEHEGWPSLKSCKLKTTL